MEKELQFVRKRQTKSLDVIVMFFRAAGHAATSLTFTHRSTALSSAIEAIFGFFPDVSLFFAQSARQAAPVLSISALSEG